MYLVLSRLVVVGTRDESLLSCKCVCRDGQVQTNDHGSLTSCFRVEGSDAIRSLWQGQGHLLNLLNNSNHCTGGLNGDTVSSRLRSRPDGNEARIDACPQVDVARSEALIEVGSQLAVARSETLIEVGSQLPVARSETLIEVGSQLPVARTGALIEVGPQLPVARSETLIQVGPQLPVARSEALIEVGSQLPVARSETLIEVGSQLPVARTGALIEVGPQLPVARSETLIQVGPQLPVARSEALIEVGPQLPVARSEALIEVGPQLPVAQSETLIEVGLQLPVAHRESIIKSSLQSEHESRKSVVKVFLQSMPDSKESKIHACRNHTLDMDHPKKETSVSQVNNIIAEWRKGGSVCTIQPLYNRQRKSRLPANSRINIRKKHITYAALRHGTCTHARSRRGDATGAGGDRNTCLTQYVGPCWRVRLEHRRSPHIQRLVPKIVQQLTSSRRLPSCFLNVNTNAGITDTSEKIEAKQASCTSVHSSDQYFSTHTDTPDGKVMDSDNEVSPSFSFTEDAAEKVVLSPHSNSDPVLSESCDQVIQLRQLDNKDKRREFGETSRHRGHKKSAEEATNEENVDIKAEKHLRTNPGVLSAVQDDQQTNKHKKKTKTTETVYIKFESSLSKKVTTTTTLLKDGKRQGTNKSKSDTHKQLPPLDDAQKAICNAPEKVDHRNLVETPRHTKIVRCSDGHQESPNEMLKCNEDIIWLGVGADESSHKKASQNVVRATESEDHLQHFRTPPQSSYRPDTPGTASSMSERITSQRSPTKPHAPKSCVEARLDHLDSDYASERESSAATIVNVPNVSPRTKTSPIKEGKEHTARYESVNKLDKTKQTDSPLREHRSTQEKKEQPKHASPNKESGCSRVETKGHDHSQTAASLVSRTESPKLDSSSTVETSSRKRSTAKHKGDSPQKKSPLDIIAKLDSKKVISSKVRSRTTDDLSTKDDAADHPKGKSLQQQSTSSRKRSPARTKTQSRSPDSKRRKRSAKKTVDSRSSKSPDFWKLDKSKRVKSADKTVDKKKKKKKQKQKAIGISEADSSHKLSSSKKEIVSSRSRSIESNKTYQTLSSSTSAPHCVEDVSLAQQLSPGGYWKSEDGKLSQQGERCNGGMLDRDNSMKPRETKVKNRAAASAENVSMSEGTAKPIRAAESVPTFTGTVYTSITKVVQVASCPKVKKSEKDLQQAELGWNSSKLSAEERAAAEKLKQNQRKVKARYVLMRSKSKSNDCEQATAKGKRPMPRRNQADGDSEACEVSDNSDSPQPEKTKLGQGKSVQFSQSTEDHEASRDETTDEGSAHQQNDENDVALSQTGDKFAIVLQPSGKTIILPQPIQKPTTISAASGKPTADTLKPVNKPEADASLAPNKPTIQKREEQRSQTTPPRKRRPIWQKKPPKEKAVPNMKAQTAAVKPVPALVPIKQRQSSDNILKPPARLNLGFLYPGKSKAQCPSFSNISLDDKRAVAYNTWINGSILAAPMNKATRKLVAKAGSPVDIKEIIEGSSVDAAEYHRSMRALHELGVRAAKSVPALGPRRTTSTDVVGSKRCRLPPGCQKKNKVHESSSTRSLSSVDGTDQQELPSKNGAAGRDTSVSPVSSSDVDYCPGLKYRVGSNRLTEQGYPRKKKEKRGKKFSKDASGKWHAVNAQDVHSVPDLTRVQYYGDVTDFNALNMGLSWMVQSVFSRLPFLNQRQASSANASGDMPAGHGGE